MGTSARALPAAPDHAKDPSPFATEATQLLTDWSAATNPQMMAWVQRREFWVGISMSLTCCATLRQGTMERPSCPFLRCRSLSHVLPASQVSNGGCHHSANRFVRFDVRYSRGAAELLRLRNRRD